MYIFILLYIKKIKFIKSLIIYYINKQYLKVDSFFQLILQIYQKFLYLDILYFLFLKIQI